VAAQFLGDLRSWATSANPMYKDGLLVAANTAKAYADARWNYATQMPASGWHDTGSTSWEGDNTEAYAEFSRSCRWLIPIRMRAPNGRNARARS
jgi:hypothetical protein